LVFISYIAKVREAWLLVDMCDGTKCLPGRWGGFSTTARHVSRWIERYNFKLREVGKKEERRRLKEFINAAYELDPRVARRKQEKKEERCAPPYPLLKLVN
jgi:hypothetical protein